MNNRLLLIEDEQAFANILMQRLERSGFNCHHANNIHCALDMAQELSPTHIVLDMKVGSGNGLHILPKLREYLSDARIILLTGYASIATAVDAIKSGADDYLSKPVDSSALLAALKGEKASTQEQKTVSLPRLEWEHIQQILKQNDGNVSATARQLGMHRRTLQRKLLKKPKSE